MEPDERGGDERNGRSKRLGTESAVWRCCHEYAAVTSRLKRLEAEGGYRAQDEEEVKALWDKREEVARETVEAPALTVDDVLLKAALTATILSDRVVEVGLTLQCLAECGRALAAEGEEEQCLRALEPELWGRRKRVEELAAELEARWESVESGEGFDDAGGSLATAWDNLNEAVWSVARYDARTPIGLRAKGTVFTGLEAFVGEMDGLSALQDSYLQDFYHLAYRRLHGKDSRLPRRSFG
jgi:hypothetical protein